MMTMYCIPVVVCVHVPSLADVSPSHFACIIISRVIISIGVFTISYFFQVVPGKHNRFCAIISLQALYCLKT